MIREFWGKLFETNEAGQFHSVSTDGIAVSVIMSKTKKVPALPRCFTEPNDPETDFRVDPGYRLAFAGVRRDIRSGAETDLKKNEVNIKKTSKQWRNMTGANDRKQRLDAMTQPIESKIRREREQLNNIGPTSVDFVTWTRFELRWFMIKCKVYHDPA